MTAKQDGYVPVLWKAIANLIQKIVGRQPWNTGLPADTSWPHDSPTWTIPALAAPENDHHGFRPVPSRPPTSSSSSSGFPAIAPQLQLREDHSPEHRYLPLIPRRIELECSVSRRFVLGCSAVAIEAAPPAACAAPVTPIAGLSSCAFRPALMAILARLARVAAALPSMRSRLAFFVAASPAEKPKEAGTLRDVIFIVVCFLCGRWCWTWLCHQRRFPEAVGEFARCPCVSVTGAVPSRQGAAVAFLSRFAFVAAILSARRTTADFLGHAAFRAAAAARLACRALTALAAFALASFAAFALSMAAAFRFAFSFKRAAAIRFAAAMAPGVGDGRAAAGAVVVSLVLSRFVMSGDRPDECVWIGHADATPPGAAGRRCGAISV